MSNKRPALLLRLWREHVHRYWPLMVLAFVLMSIEGGSLGAMSYLIRPLFDDVFVAGNESAAVWVALSMSGIFLLRALAGFCQKVLVVTIGFRVTTELQTRLLTHLLSLDARFFQDHPPGALIERVRGDTQALQGVASTTLMSLGRDTISVVSLLAVMLWSDWVWTLLALIGVPVLFLPLSALQRLIRRTTTAARETAARLTNQLDEIFHGIVAIKVNRLETHETDRFKREVKHFLSVQLKSERGKAASPALIDIIAALGFFAVLLYGGYQIIAEEKSVGQFMSFFTALGLIFDPMRRLSSVAGQVQAGLASLERLYAVLEARASVLPPADPQPIAPGALRFEDVQFAYDEAPVLRGFSFTAEQGQTTALVGPSGAGKSTVFNLITRLIDPNAGAITLGGTPVDAAKIEALRDHIALVGQDTALFDESIAENIRRGRLNATQSEIRAAAEAASVMEFADSLPEGLDTEVGPRGSGLSGGQRQRVAIARAMLRDAPILLLDEPTSALDARSERLVGEALARLSKGRTTIVIAHRLSTIREADKIVVMDQGRAVEEGDHEALLARGGAYARLHALQATGIE